MVYFAVFTTLLSFILCCVATVKLYRFSPKKHYYECKLFAFPMGPAGAGVDYLVFDATNGFPYKQAYTALLEVLTRYQSWGWDVPQTAFYTNTASLTTIQAVYFKVTGYYGHLYRRKLSTDGPPELSLCLRLTVKTNTDAHFTTSPPGHNFCW